MSKIILFKEEKKRSAKQQYTQGCVHVYRQLCGNVILWAVYLVNDILANSDNRPPQFHQMQMNCSGKVFCSWCVFSGIRWALFLSIPKWPNYANLLVKLLAVVVACFGLCVFFRRPWDHIFNIVRSFCFEISKPVLRSIFIDTIFGHVVLELVEFNFLTKSFSS